MLHTIINFFNLQSEMCEAKTIIVLLSISFLAGAGFWSYQVQAEKEMGHHSEIRSQTH